MSPTVLVTGPTGTTGRATVQALLAAGATLRVASRQAADPRLPAGVAAVPFDWQDRRTWAPALDGVDALSLVTPSFHPDEGSLAADLAAAAVQAGVRRIVKLSAMGVEQMPENGHRQAEIAIERSGAAWIHLRPNFFMENFIHFYGEGIRTAGGIFLPAGDGASSFVAAADIGRAAAAALLSTRSGEAWDLTGPAALTHTEVAAVLSAQRGAPVVYHALPAEVARAQWASFGMSPFAIARMDMLYAAVSAGWCAAVTDTVARETGRAPLDFATWAHAQGPVWG